MKPDPSEYRVIGRDRTLALSPTDKDGVLIVGHTRGSRTPTALIFHSYDPAAKRLVPPSKGGIHLKVEVGRTIFQRSDLFGNVQYDVIKVPAGHYYLSKVMWRDRGAYATTLFDEIDDGSVAIEVAPGKVTYAGTLAFQTPFLALAGVPIGDVAFWVSKKNDAQARNVLAGYPHVKGPMVSPDLKMFRLDCDLDKGVEACYAN